jgi:hypothetical protein
MAKCPHILLNLGITKFRKTMKTPFVWHIEKSCGKTPQV